MAAAKPNERMGRTEYCANPLDGEVVASPLAL